MVEELDLTDHDVSVIAAMIDSEIQCHIPDWTPREPLGNNSSRGQGDDVSSATANDSPKSGPSILEKLPSGRKYWSDSPKDSSESSPLRSGPSSLLLVESVTPGDCWSDENVQSPINHKQDGNSDLHDSRFGDIDIVTLNLEQNLTVGETDLDGIRSIVERVENVLDEQVKEIDELRKKHELAVLDMLKEIPQETRQRVVSICDQKTSERKFRYTEEHFTDELSDQSSSKMFQDIPK